MTYYRDGKGKWVKRRGHWPMLFVGMAFAIVGGYYHFTPVWAIGLVLLFLAACD